MWLLSTDRAELHYFPSPEAVTGGYATLSHVWDGEEQMFERTQTLYEKFGMANQNPRDHSSDKVCQCCILAECHGYRWIWDDACCIDKSSSTEISQAINSIFTWFSLSEVCFVYMADVDSDCNLYEPDSAFRTTEWHSRAGTLQELIAPFLLIFVSRDWKILGNKRELAPLLEEITGVRREVLTGEMHCSVVKLAERMSWASKRVTTHEEDRAYSLMGLFDVKMPTIYGEGPRAFKRLQQKIMKESFDMSIFAWGNWIDLEDAIPMELQEVQRMHTSFASQSHLLAVSPDSFGVPLWRSRNQHDAPSATNPSQRRFDEEWNVGLGGQQSQLGDSVKGLSLQLSQLFQRGVPSCSVTTLGFKCHFPIIELPTGLTIVLLLCDDHFEHLGLLLCPSNDRPQDPSRKMYRVGYAFYTPRHSEPMNFARLISLGKEFHNWNLRLSSRTVTLKVEWRDIFIVDNPPQRNGVALSHWHCFPLHSIVPAPPFRLPHWLIGRLSKMGLDLQPLDIRYTGNHTTRQPLVVEAQFVSSAQTETVLVILGTCTQSPFTQTHWAKALMFSHGTRKSRVYDYSHDCRTHHVVAWPDWKKDFGDAVRKVRLSFSRCTLNPQYTLVVHIQLEGYVYEDMKNRKGVKLPSREGLGLVSGRMLWGLAEFSSPSSNAYQKFRSFLGLLTDTNGQAKEPPKRHAW